MLDVYGLGANIKLLDGGRKLLAPRSLPVTAEVPSFAASSITLPECNEKLRARLADVLAIAQGRVDGKLIDIRSPDEYLGKIFASDGVKELSIRAGHIPGAEAIFREQRMSRGRPSSTTTVPSKPVEENRNIYAARGFDDSKPIVTYCRIGERSKQLMVRVEAASWLRCPARRLVDRIWQCLA